MKLLRYVSLLCYLSFAGSMAEAQEPHWTCDERQYEYSMTVFMSASLNNNDIDKLSDYEIAAFCDNECRGVMTVETTGGIEYGYLRVRSNGLSNESVFFKLYDKENDKEVISDNVVMFVSNSRLGFPSEPYKVNFSNIYSVTLKPSDSQCGSVSGGGKYKENAMATIQAKPNPGYLFDQWSNGVKENPYTFAVTQDVELTAQFSICTDTNFIAVDNADNEIVRFFAADDTIELADGGYKSVSITENINNVNITYSRTYKNTSWQAWYVPFGFVLTSDIASQFSFAKFAGTYTEAGQFFITLVEMQEGETIKANTPYFVQAKTADSTNPQVLNISNTTLHATDASGLKMLSAEKEIAIFGTYAKKVAAANDDWYAYGGGSYIKAKEGQNLGAFRFYLTIRERDDNPYQSSQNYAEVKVIVLDNEADGISSIESDVNVNSNIMFNLAGQPVGSDYKGVVIRNGKKTFIH